MEAVDVIDDGSVLVTGGCGLLGAVDIVAGDICTEGLIARVLTEYDVTSVFHLAAQTLVGPANRYGGGDTNRSRLVPEAVGAAVGDRTASATSSRSSAGSPEPESPRTSAAPVCRRAKSIVNGWTSRN